MKIICAFAGAAQGRTPNFSSEAYRLGQMIGAKGHKIIYGGGRTGLMGSFADGALSAAAAHCVGALEGGRAVRV